MNLDKFVSNILNDLRVELAEEFDRNFERKSFFGVPWAPRKRPGPQNNLMVVTGSLRQSMSSNVAGNTINFTSSLPYASIHNEGGQITVTPRMKKFFWAMYYKASGAVPKNKDGTASRGKAATQLSAEAAYYKSLALMKVGSKLKIPKRQFIGYHPKMDDLVKQIVSNNAEELGREFGQALAAGLRRL